MNRKDKRKQRHLKNSEKDKIYKETAWESGKFIEPNHNGEPYPEDYSVEVVKRLRGRLEEFKTQNSSNEYLIGKFRLYRIKIRDAIIYYNPNSPIDDNYMYLVNAYETYQDNPENLHNII